MSAQDGCKLPVRAKINVLSFGYFWFGETNILE